jgi:hypothetical protein
VHTTLPSTETVIVAPGSPVPVTVGVGSLVLDPAVGEVTTGAAGATVSTTKERNDVADTLPPVSVCVALIV